MKIVINEKQYFFLLEQKSDFAYDRQGNALLNATGIRNNADYDTTNQVINKAQEQLLTNIDPHIMASVLSVAALLIPVAGPFISSGIQLLDAGLYLKNGDKKNAGLTALLSILPVASKIPGVKELGAKGLSTLASKITKIKNPKLTELEVILLQSIAKNKDFLIREISKYTQNLANQIIIKNPEFSKYLTPENANKLSKVAKMGISNASEYSQEQIKTWLYNYGYDKSKLILTNKK